MTPAVLLQTLEQVGAVLTPQPDGALRCKAPKDALTHVMRADLRQHKAALVALLKERDARTLPPVPCLVHDAIFFERQGEGLICWKCIVLASRSV